MGLEELVIKARTGDDTAFYDLIQENREMLYKIAFSYVGDQDLSLEIISETVYKAYTNIRKLKNEQFFKTWLTRILINCCLDTLRKRKRVVPFHEQSAAPMGEERRENEELMDLRNAIGKLQDKYKTIILLKYYQNLTLTEIAAILGTPLGTVKTNLHKALKVLRIDLKEDAAYE